MSEENNTQGKVIKVATSEHRSERVSFKFFFFFGGRILRINTLVYLDVAKGNI